MSSRGDVTVEMLEEILAAFNRHDLDAIMTYFSDDAVFESPRGPEPWGIRYVGKDAVREGLAARFSGIPDVSYSDDRHWVCGNQGLSEWRIRGTSTSGELVDHRGCDLWEFRDGLVVRKDSFWKNRI